MEQRGLTIQRREGTGKSVAKRLRRSGRVPGILYGGPAAVPITADPRDVLRLIHGHEGSTQLLTVTFDGSPESRMAIIRDMQFDPVSEALVHVDLQEVAMDRPITVSVAVHPVGEPAGVRDQQGILNLVMHELTVSCLPSLIPERIDADVSALMIGDVLTVSQLTVPAGVRILNDPNQAVATVSPPRAEEVPVAAAAAVTAPAEPEVLTERKPKEPPVEEAAGKEGGKRERDKEREKDKK
jgi:large subunit ribosomal protein L25